MRKKGGLSGGILDAEIGNRFIVRAHPEQDDQPR